MRLICLPSLDSATSSGRENTAVHVVPASPPAPALSVPLPLLHHGGDGVPDPCPLQHSPLVPTEQLGSPRCLLPSLGLMGPGQSAASVGWRLQAMPGPWGAGMGQ